MKSDPPATPSGRPSAPSAPSATLDSQPPAVPDHELLRKIGDGSYGEVWLARNAVGTLRAVKIVHRKTFWSDHPFEREFKGIQKFEPISRSHEGLVDVLQIGRGDGYFYYVMELADAAEDEREKGREGAGENSPLSPSPPFSPASYSPKTLDSLRFPPAHFPTFPPALRARLPPADCIRIGLALSDALAHLHQHGLVHRDIKPANIIFVGSEPKLADIGLVAEVSEARSYVGTEGFIPPEGPGTPQADLYSLGKLLYEISTGQDRHAFPALPPDLAEQAEAQQLVELNAILLKACQPDPRERYSSAEEMLAELELLQAGQSIRQRRKVQGRLAVAKNFSIGAAALGLLAAGVWLLANRFDSSTLQGINAPIEIPSIAVLPFVNESKYPPHEYLCDALTDETMNALTNCAGLRVGSRPAVLAFKHATNDLRHIGQLLGVRAVMGGTFLRNSNGMWVRTKLVNASDGAEIWSATFERKREDFGSLGAEMARQAAHALHVQLPGVAEDLLVANLDRKLQAYQFLSAGQQRLTFDSYTKSNFTEAVNFLQQALTLDLNCVQAHLGLGQAYKRFSSWHLAPREAMPTARSHLLRVLELDPTSARARSMLGVIKLNFDYDWAGAEADLRRAVELDRDPVMLSGWLCHLWVQGRWEEAEAVAKENRRAEPEASWTASELAGTYYYQRKYDLMLEQVRWILQRNPDNPWGHAWSFRAHLGREEFPEALSALARVIALDPSPFEIAAEGHVHGRMGRVEDALRAVAELDRLSTQRFVPKMCWALVYTGLNERQKALAFLEQAADERSDTITLLKVDPMWDGLRSEPGFSSLLRRIGLE